MISLTLTMNEFNIMYIKYATHMSNGF